MKQSLFTAAVFPVLIVAQMAQAGQKIGQITDPCNLSIDGYTDILSACVERSSTKLTFVMEMRANIPDASQLPDYNDTITYIWLVNADNNPATGQNPGGAGSEFNIRAVLGKLVVDRLSVTVDHEARNADQRQEQTIFLQEDML